MEPEAVTPEIIRPARDANSFEVGGTVYTATDGLSVARLKIFQRLSLEFAVDTGLMAHIQALDSIWSDLNGLKVADAIHTLGMVRDSMAAGVSRNRLKGPEICALFFNTKIEDPGVYDHAAMQEKVRAFGSIHGGFFTVAAIRLGANSLSNYTDSPKAQAPEENPALLPNDLPS